MRKCATLPGVLPTAAVFFTFLELKAKAFASLARALVTSGASLTRFGSVWMEFLMS